MKETQNRNTIIIIGLAALAILLFVLLWPRAREEAPITTDDTFTYDKTGPCPGPEVELTLHDPYMRGYIELDQKYKVILNYYQCNKAEPGDVIAYQNMNNYPTVKIVRAVTGDKYRLIADKKMKSWNIEINGQLLMSGDVPHFFGAETKPTLSLYESARKNGLLDGEVLIFSSWAPGDRDSGIFGVYSSRDFVGKVVMTEEQTAAIKSSFKVLSAQESASRQAEPKGQSQAQPQQSGAAIKTAKPKPAAAASVPASAGKTPANKSKRNRPK